jgi:glycogen(starch) synthase
MNILLCSRSFLPTIGGISTASDAMARALVRRDHEVTVFTETPAIAEVDVPYHVLRRPSPGQLLAAVQACDIYLHNNLSLRGAWPLLFARRPWIVVHQIYLRQRPPSLTFLERVKRMTLRWAHSIAISTAVARDLPFPATIIPNSYRNDLFRLTNPGERQCDLAFLGRLVPEKGASVLLMALSRLRQRGCTPRLRLIGNGPEEPMLRRQVAELGLESQVEFAGQQTGEELVMMLNDCRILAVPSLWAEPFGIVALEAIACGCVVVGSADGGLPDAIGPCGLTFPNGDDTALANRLMELLHDPVQLAALRAHAPAHLARHTSDAITEALLRVMIHERTASCRPPPFLQPW